jgi:hypothetical protein
MNELIPRLLLEEIKKWIDRREIIAIKGPRQAGKTTLLKLIQGYLINEKKVNPENIIYLTFEDRDILEKFSQAPKEYLNSFISHLEGEKFYFFIDEFHYLKNGGQILKLLYDLYENVKFIITGSSSLELISETARFLVGRLFSFYLFQFNFQEYLTSKSTQLANVYKERKEMVTNFITSGKDFKFERDIFVKDFLKLFQDYSIYGGYPEVVKAKDIEGKQIILKNIFDTYISKDIVELLKIIDYSKLRRLLIILGSQIGSVINYNNLALDTSSYYKEIRRYLSMLEETFIINLIKPFFRNKITELKKNPKVYFIDTGLRNYILKNFNPFDIRVDHGNLVENAVFTQLKIAFPDISINYWRTLAKAEVDFILNIGDRIIPIEVKFTSFKSPKVSRAFKNFIEEYKPQKALILTKDFWASFKIGKTMVKFIPAFYI